MKYISYILMGISAMLAILALVLLLKKEAVLRDKLLDTLQNARDTKATIRDTAKEAKIMADEIQKIDDEKTIKKERNDSTKEKT